jgi:hypothetical protein
VTNPHQFNKKKSSLICHLKAESLTPLSPPFSAFACLFGSYFQARSFVYQFKLLTYVDNREKRNGESTKRKISENPKTDGVIFLTLSLLLQAVSDDHVIPNGKCPTPRPAPSQCAAIVHTLAKRVCGCSFYPPRYCKTFATGCDACLDVNIFSFVSGSCESNGFAV